MSMGHLSLLGVKLKGGRAISSLTVGALAVRCMKMNFRVVYVWSGKELLWRIPQR
jgi:hypothetical protein